MNMKRFSLLFAILLAVPSFLSAQTFRDRSARETPEWFRKGVEAALLAPTATNQQKFTLHRDGNTVSLRKGIGPYAACDLGIVRYHFEIGAGKENFRWK